MKAPKICNDKFQAADYGYINDDPRYNGNIFTTYCTLPKGHEGDHSDGKGNWT